MRHGKSSWELNVSDQDRPLQQRGILDAHKVGAALATKNLEIDLVFSSPANRALHTAMICLRELNYPLDNFAVHPDLYDFSGDKILEFLRGLDDKLTTVMIFGHNHAFTYLANAFGDKRIDNVPTSGLVHLHFKDKNWSSIDQGSTVQTLFPKQI